MPYLPEIARLRIELFRAYPYLYDGDRAYEEHYLQTYVEAPQGVALIAFAGDVVVGVSTGIPLDCETAACRAPFLSRGYKTESVFYCGESLLQPAFRGRGVYRQFLSGREAFARERGFATSAFCAVDRPSAHPQCPPAYRPLDEIWSAFGYVQHPELIASYRWKDVGDAAETEKSMIFWLKALADHA